MSRAELDLVTRLAGGTPTPSPRLQLRMPVTFRNGYSVPVDLAVDSPMTDQDYVRQVKLIAPLNPIVVVAVFHFTPSSGRAEISTRIRLSRDQGVVAVAEMADGARLMARSWVKVDSNGCE